MKDNNGRFKFEEDDVECASNCFQCDDVDIHVINFDKVKDDYVRIKGIGGKPNSCDYVVIARDVRSRLTEIWLIEKTDIIHKLVQKLSNLKEKEGNDKIKENFYKIFVDVIKEDVGEALYKFVYSATILSDILSNLDGSCSITISDLNDKSKYRFRCLILYQKVLPKTFEHIVRLFILSLGDERAIFITPEKLCKELKNYSDVKLVSCDKY